MHKLTTLLRSDLIPPPLLQPNEKLDRFVIGRRVHEGLMSHVYHAHDPLRSVDICLKLINGYCPSARAVLEQEFRTLNRFASCDNIINVYDIHEFEYGPSKLIALSMEYARDGSLADWLEANRSNVDLRREEGKRFLAEIINGLALLHQCDLPHPDFDPGNMLLCNGHLKLANLANWAAFPGISVDEAEFLLGRPEYKAPERFVATKASELSIAADIYTVGIIAWQLFSDSARPPFEGDFNQVKEKHLFLEPPLLGLNPEDQILRRCLNKSSMGRYQTLNDLKDDLIASQAPGVDPTGEVSALLYNSLIEMLNEGNMQESYELCLEALSLSPNRGDLLEIKRQLEPTIKRFFSSMEDVRTHIDERSINHNIDMLNRAVQLNGGLTEEMQIIADILERRFIECQSYIQSGQAAVAQQNWSLALDYFERAWQMNSSDQELSGWRSLLTEIVEAKRGMENCMQNGNQSSAVYFAEKLDGFIARLGMDESQSNSPEN